ncbi:maleylpyruvate isomerase [Propionicimonas paludicola]|uniref:Maleylpyruvate isomerase n=1 Tax=Propionicimonas paludicola TaxID=185243 RepID=A0A2A9CRF0_9ACTN|nr:maleylpyruvate isomerase family mycothiol-dependent enzyme [Propionicimonas paludicola]PFG16948.1 maleylpyruvate isomerase [Propionicimonas paludicola]
MSSCTDQPPAEVHRWLADATQRLLGHTIGISETEWHQPTALPGWTRAHLATHLARNADYLTNALSAVESGEPQPGRPTAADERRVLEEGADRSGLELQIDLDTSAGALQRAIDAVADWSTGTIALHGQICPLDRLPLARLNELEMHHYDLDPHRDLTAVDSEEAGWLLRWVIERRQQHPLPSVRLVGEGVEWELGTGEPRLEVRGTDIELWLWLSGRGRTDHVEGTDDLVLPLLS